MFTDRNLVCADCQASFVFTAGEQEFHAQKGFSNDPRRCPSCRSARKSARNEGGGGGGYNRGGGGGGGRDQHRQMYEVTCAECGQQTQVPFQPRGDRPVYCSNCFRRDDSRSFSGRGGGGGGGYRR
jgi:CxxC-x17-CxxC domain-containing protein